MSGWGPSHPTKTPVLMKDGGTIVQVDSAVRSACCGRRPKSAGFFAGKAWVSRGTGIFLA
ncbi:hypothetical protein F220043C3_11600 [Enterocloster asparagiformis]